MWSGHWSEKPAMSVRFAPPAPDVADAEVDEAAGCDPVLSGFKYHRPPQVIAGSVNGKPPVFEAGFRGSIPRPAAIVCGRFVQRQDSWL